MNIDEAVGSYVELRDTRDEIKKRHTEELSPYVTAMKDLEAYFLDVLNTSGAKNIATDAGTVFKSTSTSAKVADWDEVLAFIREHNLWHLLEKRVAKVAVEEYLEAHGEIPPGVDVTRDATVRVRRPTK